MDILTGGKKMTISLEQIESKLSEGRMQVLNERACSNYERDVNK